MNKSRFDSVLEERIIQKAKRTEEKFYKEFEDLLCRYGLDRNVIFYGMRHYRSEEKKEDWQSRSFEVFVKRATENFMNQLSRIEHYFIDNVSF